MIKIHPIEAFNDNYIWLIRTNTGSIVFDPGESSNLLSYLDKNILDLKAIFITHHHFDHTGGIDDILSKNKSITVYGPDNNINSITNRLQGGDQIKEIGINFEVIEIPGHTLDHIAYFSENHGDPILFCGDTLFAGGCGRVFEGTFSQMHESLGKLKNLPKNTKIYCGHEYTLSNLEFAKEVEPLNEIINKRYNEVSELRNKGIPTLPTTLSIELQSNPFLRTDIQEVQNRVFDKFKTNKNDQDVFKAIRQWKDSF